MSLNVTGVDGVGWERPCIASAGSTQLHCAFAMGCAASGAFGMPGAAAPLLYELVMKCGLVLLRCPARCSCCRIHSGSPKMSKNLSSIPSTTCPCRGTHPAGSRHHPMLLHDPHMCSVPHTSPSPLPSLGMPAVHKGLELHSYPVLLSWFRGLSSVLHHGFVPSLPTCRLAGCNSGGWAETLGPLVLMSSAPTLMRSRDVMGAELCS
uniref:Uncharacterized protein n=1 Tax=Phasianus colchicus TaxID=9054 RepID=A0A669NWA8_PHACC